jgi:hypothetical protein
MLLTNGQKETDLYGITMEQRDHTLPTALKDGTANLKRWHAHPNIYTAIQLFKKIQNSIEIAKIQRAVGGTIRPQAKKYLNVDRRLATLKDRYQTGVIDLITYADSASQLLHLGWLYAWFLCRCYYSCIIIIV